MNYPIYYLSGRQLHELDRGFTRQVALPMPADEPDDLIVYARDHLHVRRSLILDADEDELTVWPKPGEGEGATRGLETALGEIAYKQSEPHTLTLQVVVIAVTIGSSGSRRGSSRIQWPAGAEIGDGVWVPKGFQPSRRT